MVRRLLFTILLLSMVVCVTSACPKKQSGVAPTLATNDATVAIMGGTRSGPAGPQIWQSFYGEVTLHGQLTDLGSSDQVGVGFVWGPSSVSSMATGNSYPYQCTATGTGVYAGNMLSSGSFEGNIMGLGYTGYLQPGTTYYFRAYASISDGTTWGDEYSFHTVNPGSGLTVSNHGATEYTDTLQVVGQALNRTSQTLSHESVTVVFKDAQGRTLDTATYSTDEDIPGITVNPNGGLWGFSLWYPGTDVSVVASYELTVSGT